MKVKIVFLFETPKLQEFLYKIYKTKIKIKIWKEGFLKEAENLIAIKNKKKNLKIKSSLMPLKREKKSIVHKTIHLIKLSLQKK